MIHNMYRLYHKVKLNIVNTITQPLQISLEYTRNLIVV